MIQLAIALPAGCVIGWLVGSWLDKHFHQNWIVIVGILLGALAGFIQIFRTASRYSEEGRFDERRLGRRLVNAMEDFHRRGLQADDLERAAAAGGDYGVAAPLLWWKLGWQSAVLLLVGAVISGSGLCEWLRLMTAVMVRMDDGEKARPMGTGVDRGSSCGWG